MHDTNEFTQILGAIGIETFISAYWERAPLYIPRGASDSFIREYNLDSFFAALNARPDLVDKVIVQYFDARSEHREESVRPTQARAMFDAGRTICVGGFGDGDTNLLRIASAACSSLGHAGDVGISAYVSPDSGGFGLHFDCQSVFVLQCDGIKCWRYSALPAMHRPPTNLVASRTDCLRFREQHPWSEFDAPHVDTLLEQRLFPGDVLYLPAGTWHCARAEGHAVALSLTIMPLSAQDLILDALQKTLESQPPWRAYLPMSSQDDLANARLKAFLAERLDELGVVIKNLTPAQLAIRWHKARVRKLPLRLPAQPPIIGRSTVVKVAQPTMLIEDPASNVIVLFAGAAAVQLELSSENHGFLRELAQRQEFVAYEATRFCTTNEELDWNEVKDALASLASVGAISPIE